MILMHKSHQESAKRDQIKTITRSSSSSDEKSNMKGGMDAPSGGGMQGGNKQGGGMPYGGKQ